MRPLPARPAPSNGLELPPTGSGRPRGGRSRLYRGGCGLWAPGPRGSRLPLRAMAKAVDVVRLLLGSTALCFSLLGGWTASASKAVTAHLAAKWPETPLLLEARWVRAGPSAEPRAEGGSAGLWARRCLPPARTPSLWRAAGTPASCTAAAGALVPGAGASPPPLRPRAPHSLAITFPGSSYLASPSVFQTSGPLFNSFGFH